MAASKGTTAMTQGNPRDEYAHASENIRHYQAIRFTLLTVFITISAGILTGFALTYSTSPGSFKLILKLAGLANAILFWILQERTMLYWNHFVRRAAELESSLGYKLYSARPKAGIVTAANAVRLFFLVIATFWVAAIIWVR
jgi:hypothetical protein